MRDKDRHRKAIQEYQRVVLEERRTNYFNYRRIDPLDPDFVPIVEELIEAHPDPLKSKKGLCSDIGISVDGYRKSLAGRFGPAFGLVDRLMGLTGCYKPLYWLARRHGFIIVADEEIRWDNRRKLHSLNDLDKNLVQLKSILLDLQHPKVKRSSHNNKKLRTRAKLLIRIVQEQLVGWDIAISSIDPQINLFQGGD